MHPFDPVLDQPQVLETIDEPSSIRSRLANYDVTFEADANSDLYELQWPWANERYVKSIRMRIDDPHSDDLMTLATRYYPGYQETILGNEGMIISKRLTAPLGSHYDRSVIWTLECQAEGDRLFRLDFEIDWGEPLTQRIVDGLLVAQRNPSSAQGIYKQRNADRTCVFGNPHGRPSAYEFDDDGKAVLTYYILVNGIVDVPLLLTVSDVGEQVAWSGFLALRDAESEFNDSAKRWDQALHAGRLWTSNPILNRAVQYGRLECMRRIQRVRTGFASNTRLVPETPALIECTDAFDPTLSRNILANLRRVAERSEGRLPVALPVRPKDELEEPGDALSATNSAYLIALHRHLSRHPDADVLAAHRSAAALCADALVRIAGDRRVMIERRADIADGLSAAARLAELAGDSANAARWESEAEALASAVPSTDGGHSDVSAWLDASGWRCPDDKPWGFVDEMGGIGLAGRAVWSVTGLEWYDNDLWAHPRRITELHWWALVDWPMGDQRVTLVWDGQTLYTTLPVRCDQPVVVVDRIMVRNTDEHSFDLKFEMQRKQEVDGDPISAGANTALFTPAFSPGVDD